MPVTSHLPGIPLKQGGKRKAEIQKNQQLRLCIQSEWLRQHLQCFAYYWWCAALTATLLTFFWDHLPPAHNKWQAPASISQVLPLPGKAAAKPSLVCLGYRAAAAPVGLESLNFNHQLVVLTQDLVTNLFTDAHFLIFKNPLFLLQCNSNLTRTLSRLLR